MAVGVSLKFASILLPFDHAKAFDTHTESVAHAFTYPRLFYHLVTLSCFAYLAEKHLSVSFHSLSAHPPCTSRPVGLEP